MFGNDPKKYELLALVRYMNGGRDDTLAYVRELNSSKNQKKVACVSVIKVMKPFMVRVDNLDYKPSLQSLLRQSVRLKRLLLHCKKSLIKAIVHQQHIISMQSYPHIDMQPFHCPLPSSECPQRVY